VGCIKGVDRVTYFPEAVEGVGAEKIMEMVRRFGRCGVTSIPFLG
jgi:hypothetical protein